MNELRISAAYPIRISFLLFILSGFLNAQQPKWQRGVGTAVGTDVEAIRLKALNNARADALAKAGITVTAGDARLVSESGNSFIDFYSKFAESSTKGIILEERIIREGDLKKIKGTTYEIEIEIEANVAVQQGEADRSFSVNLESSKQIVQEGEPFTLTVTSTKAGYLSIFNIYQDSLSLVFPNPIDKSNTIDAGKSFVFPPNKNYELQLAVPSGKTTSSEMFIAVVTLEHIPFPNLDQLNFTNGSIRLRMEQLNVYAKWLYGVPLNKRSSDQFPITVQK
jgi:hypothetical protein